MAAVAGSGKHWHDATLPCGGWTPGFGGYLFMLQDIGGPMLTIFLDAGGVLLSKPKPRSRLHIMLDDIENGKHGDQAKAW